MLHQASLRISAIWQSTIADTTAVTQELDSITELLQEVGTRVEKVASAIEKHNQTLQSKHSTLTQLSEYVWHTHAPVHTTQRSRLV